MKNLKLVFLFLLIIGNLFSQNKDSLALRRIANDILNNGQCYQWLDHLSNKVGGRLSGSKGAAAAVEYTYQTMKSLGVDTVYLQECMVPHWVRGAKESAKIITSKKTEQQVPVCALGGSIATPPEGLTAEVIEVREFDELKKLGIEGVKGKVVFYNRPFDETEIRTFDAYGKAVNQRWSGPSEAAKYGAIGTVVRSMTGALDDNPHTGGMGYKDSVAKVPCCAISTKGANLLSSMLKADPKLKFNFKMNCQLLPDERSYNVVGEIRGSEHPEEIIVVGGHLDSWDTGNGAHDDGAGCMQSIEVLRVFKALGIRPKRTIRAVMFMNEENGGRGGDKYVELAKKQNEKHIAAVESDAGGFSPKGFSMDMPDEKKNKILGWKDLFLQYGVYDFSQNGGGADISDLKAQGACLLGLLPDSQRYFDYHHTAIDTFDKVNKRELELGAASMAMMIWLISEYGL